LFLALEKRFNFSVDELNVVAYGYRQFRSFFHVREPGNHLLPSVLEHNVIMLTFSMVVNTPLLMAAALINIPLPKGYFVLVNYVVLRSVSENDLIASSVFSDALLIEIISTLWCRN
jgi:hypothetical protein